MDQNEVAFQSVVENFDWDSQEQKEGYLAYIQYARKFGQLPEPLIDYKLSFLIQKQHEASEYWRDTFGDQISTLNQELRKLQDEVAGLRRENDLLSRNLESQSMIVSLMLKNASKSDTSS